MNYLMKTARLLPNRVNIIRNISLTTPRTIKEFHKETENGVMTIKATLTTHPSESRLIKEVKDGKTCSSGTFCPECTLGLELKHTDVLILKQYLRSDGCMLPKRITGLCRRQQRRISTLVTMAQKAGLMPNIAPPNSKMDPSRRSDWKKFNKYFIESTIKW